MFIENQTKQERSEYIKLLQIVGSLYCLNVPGVHYFDRFITNKSVSFISSIDHLAETLKKQGDSKNRNTGNIFSDFRPDKFLDLVI